MNPYANVTLTVLERPRVVPIARPTVRPAEVKTRALQRAPREAYERFRQAMQAEVVTEDGAPAVVTISRAWAQQLAMLAQDVLDMDTGPHGEA